MTATPEDIMKQTVNATYIARLAYGYELMFRELCHIGGTSGGSPQWFTNKGLEVLNRVDPLWKLTEQSNAHKPGDCLSQHVPFAAWAVKVERKAEALDRWRQEVGKLHSQIERLKAEHAAALSAAYQRGQDEMKAELFGDEETPRYTTKRLRFEVERAYQRGREETGAWQEVQADPPLDVIKSINIDNQVLAYEKGRYFNAWFTFDSFEGGWFWTDEQDSEPNPSHYRPLPAPPATPKSEVGNDRLR